MPIGHGGGAGGEHAHEGGDGGAAVGLVFLWTGHGEGLAKILLRAARDPTVGSGEAVETLDDEHAVRGKAHLPATGQRKTKGSKELAAAPLVIDRLVEVDAYDADEVERAF